MEPSNEVRRFTFKRPESNELIDHNTELTAKVREAEFTMSSAGNDMIVLHTDLLAEDGRVRRSVREHAVFTEKAEWKLHQIAESLGFASEDGQEVEFSSESLTGRTARVRVVQETYIDGSGQEQTTNRIGAWLAAA
ncbi:MAG: hypothetical protein QGF59_10140 [Pirellulaceae bacterium]|nr:hypothetical protein [Pirellulaceae bacterium]